MPWFFRLMFFYIVLKCVLLFCLRIFLSFLILLKQIDSYFSGQLIRLLHLIQSLFYQMPFFWINLWSFLINKYTFQTILLKFSNKFLLVDQQFHFLKLYFKNYSLEYLNCFLIYDFINSYHGFVNHDCWNLRTICQILSLNEFWNHPSYYDFLHWLDFLFINFKLLLINL